MNTIIQCLSEICQKHPFEEKILFVPSYSIGHQIGEHVARAGTSWINLRWITTSGYAQGLLSLDITKKHIRYISEQERLITIEHLYKNSSSPGRYFERAVDSPGIISCLAHAIHELRMAGFTHHTIAQQAFILPEKGEELAWLLKSYEHHLQRESLIDHPGLLRMAIEKLERHSYTNDSMFMVLSDFPLTGLEKKLITLGGDKNLVVIDHTHPKNLDVPKRFLSVPDKPKEKMITPEMDIELLPWLFDPRKAPGPFDDGSVSLFHALGESNEIREVFRRILKERIAFDDVEMVVTTINPYFPLIYEIGESLEIPTTFAGGLPITYTRPGRALILFLKWQAEDFQDKYLRQLISNGLLDLKRPTRDGERPGETRAVELIREARIGWGCERYLSRLQAMIDNCKADATDKAKEGKLKNLQWLKGFIQEVLHIMPGTHPEEMVSTNDVYRSSLLFLKKFCRTASELDGSGKINLIGLLESLLDAEPLNLPLRTEAERLIETITTLSVFHSTPQPGHVHVAHYRSGGYSGRSQTFVLGLSQDIFPGALHQDPVILDVERDALHDALFDSGELLHENVYMMAKLLGSLWGKTTLSYPCRDLREDRERFPASLLLGAYRIISGNHEGDYSHLREYLGQPAGFIPDTESIPLNHWEWWLSQKGLNYGAESVHASYPKLREGDWAEEKREGATISEYDGLIAHIDGFWDPLSGDVVLSCSRLEELARCPFTFFLHYMLRIEPLEEPEKDYGKWLDPLQRGSLLHTIFYRFMETLKERGERPSLKDHRQLMEHIALEEVERLKKEVPCSSDLVLEREVAEIRDAFPIFLQDEEVRCRNVEPVHFELDFGLGDDDPVHIRLKDKGSFRLRGRIDRIDRRREHHYEVWDYKTGSASGYKEHGYVDSGKQLQHALYAMAAETILRREYDPEAKVICGGYFFPTTKGNGQRIVKALNKEKLCEALEQLIRMLRSGIFPFSYDKKHCTHCDYVCVCGGPDVAVERCKEKLDNDKRLEPLNTLKSHG